jgi:hypothetical protein
MRSSRKRLCHTSIPRFVALILFALAWSNKMPAQAVQNYRNTTVANASGQPLSLIDIKDRNGKTTARLFIVGKEMTFGNDQRPIKGAGNIVAADRALPLMKGASGPRPRITFRRRIRSSMR